MLKRILSLALLAAISLAAGTPADFSGEWIFSQSKSVLDENGTQFLPLRMVLAQAGNDLTVQKFFNNEMQGDFVGEEKLTLDGKECKSEFWNSPRTSTANWSANGDTLTVATTIAFDMNGEKSEMSMKEAYSLKDNGMTLCVEHNSKSTWGERKLALIFDKKGAAAEPVKESSK
jgi:hypothetical protein